MEWLKEKWAGVVKRYWLTRGPTKTQLWEKAVLERSIWDNDDQLRNGEGVECYTTTYRFGAWYKYLVDTQQIKDGVATWTDQAGNKVKVTYRDG